MIKKYGKSVSNLDTLLVNLGNSALDKINNMDVLQYTYGEKWGLSVYNERVKRISFGFAKTNDGRFYEVTEDNVKDVKHRISAKLLLKPTNRDISIKVDSALKNEQENKNMTRELASKLNNTKFTP